jgi:hypothetical protein
MRKIVKTTTVGSLKNKLNESKGGFTLGQGFGSETRFKSNVNTNSTYNRKLDKNGGFGLGDGFTQLNEEEMVDFIANIVENMKGKTEYHNLKFVDRIANEKGLFESHAKNIKNIIRNDRTPYQLKLRKYLTENVAVEMEEIYEDYSGLKLESEMMVNEIKKTFNEIKSMDKTTNEAVAMTAEALDVPMEMVQKMVEIQKEAYETQMEGGESMDITEKLCEVYEAYQNMSEGNMESVYEELTEMMNPEPVEPYKEEGDDDIYGHSEEKEINPETGDYYTDEDMKDIYADEEAEHWINQDKMYGNYEDNLEEELCMECGDSDDDSYIEVELSSPEDFKLLPMLSKGSMAIERPSIEMPSMGMKKVSMDTSMDDENIYEVPMDYSTSNPYKKYKFDTGLSKIPYGKKKISSLEGDFDDSFAGIKSLNENLFKKHITNTKIVNEMYIQFITESLKIKKVSKCRNFILFENKIYDIKNKKIVKTNNVLTESIVWKNISVINEGWSWWGNLAQNLVSVGSVFANAAFPGSGLAIEIANGLVYLLRGYFSENDPELQNTLYLNGAITIGFSLIGVGFGGGVSVGLKAIIGSGKVAAPVVAKALLWLSGKMGYLFGRLTNYLSRGLSDRILRLIARFIPAVKPSAGLRGKAATQDIIAKCTTILNKIQTRLTNHINKLVGKAAVTKLAGKKGFDTFFTTAAKGAVKIKPNEATALLTKLGFVSGKVLKGGKYTIQSVAANGKVTILAKGAKTPFTMTAQNFLEKILLTKTFKDYVALVFKNPSTYTLAYKFLSGFKFSDNGSIESVDIANMPNIDIATQLSAEDLDLEVAGYEGETGQYTVNNQVTAVQTALQSLGKDLGAAGVDGKYGPITKAAINSVEADIEAAETTGAITVKTVNNIVAALVKANKIEEAKELVQNGITDTAIKAKLEKILSKGGAATDMLTQVKNVMDNVSNTIDDTLTESTFSEIYKKQFGLV